MNPKIEGTIALEGLIEGPVPMVQDAEVKLERWAAGFANGAVRINVQIDGGNFSAMPANNPVPIKSLAKPGEAVGEPSNVIADSLSDLLRFYPPPERTRIFSTMRSVEYRSNQEVQTLYAVGPDGRATIRQQTVAAQTAAAEQPVSRRETVRRGLTGLFIAIVVIAISSFFIDYRDYWRRLTARVENVTVATQVGAFSPYITVEIKGIDRRDGNLMLRVSATGRYPRSEAAFDALYENPPEILPPAPTSAPATSTAPSTTTAPATTAVETAPATASQPAGRGMGLLRRRQAIESLSKGVLRLDYRDKEGRLLGTAQVRISDLAKTGTIDVLAPAPVIQRQIVVPHTIEVMPQ